MSSRCQLTFAIAIAVIASPLVGVTQEKATVQGERTLNRDLTPERKGCRSRASTIRESNRRSNRTNQLTNY